MRLGITLLFTLVTLAVTSRTDAFGAVIEIVHPVGPPPPPPGTPSPVVRKIIATPDGKAMLFGYNLPDGSGNLTRSVVRVRADATLDASFNFASTARIYDANVDSSGRILVVREKSPPPPDVYYNWPAVPGVVERFSASGSPDPTFLVGSGSDLLLEHVLPLSDGAVLITGYLFMYNGQLLGEKMAKLGGNGLLDSNFKPTFVGGERYAGGPSPLVTTIPLPNGEILAGGYFPSVSGQALPSLVRLNSNGGVDTSFVPNLGYRGVAFWSGQIADLQPNVTALCRQADGKLVIAGEFTSVGGVARTNVARLNPDGSLDASFNVGLAPLNIFSIAQQQDGKLLVAALNYGYGRGTFTDFDGAPRNELARLLPDGTLDSSFNFTGQVNGAIFSVAVLTDGQIMVGGTFTSFAGVACGGAVRINPSGFVQPVAPAINSQTVRRLANKNFEFQLAAPTNQTVFIQATTNLFSGPWITIQTQTVTGGSVSVSDTGASQSARRFYRAIIR